MVELFEIDYDNVPKSVIKVRSEQVLKNKIKPHSDLFKSWYLRTCFEFLKTNNLKNSEEILIENFSDFMIASLSENVEN